MAKRRIFQIAKELNISHTEIVNFLKDNGVAVTSHMSPVDEDAITLIESEFSKDIENIARYRKEQVRRKIHHSRIVEQQKATKKLNLLSLEDQRKIEEEEKINAAKEEKKKNEEEQRKKEEDLKKKEEVEKKEKDEKKKLDKPKKQRLRKIDLSEIEAQIGQTSRPKKKEIDKKEKKVQKSVKDAVKQTLSRIDTKGKKKQYKKDKKADVDEQTGDDTKQVLKVAEFSNVEELSKYFEVNPSEIIQECLGLGKLVTMNQRLDWDVIELLADSFGFIAEKITNVGEELFSLDETEEDIKNAKPDMRLARAVENASGMILYGEGMKLTIPIIEKLNSLDIDSVYVEGKSEPRLSRERYLGIADIAFSKISNNPLMNEIKKDFTEYINSLYE